METEEFDGNTETLAGGSAEVTVAAHHRSSSSARSTTALADGDPIGSYLVERKLGSGGMGDVFLARHVERGEPVALKTLSKASPTHLYRFKREFRALADVAHDNLVRLFELGLGTDGQAFFTMEVVEGEPFCEWVRQGLSEGQLPDVVRLESALRQLVDGVIELHANNCVHRDLKPSNVLVTAEGRVVILDFGLVFELADADSGITHEGQLLGTPAYMAPEQALGEHAGPPADYYAVGVMLYECLTGRLPHSGPLLQLIVQKTEGTDISADLLDAPLHLRQICANLMVREPDKRLNGTQVLVQLEHQPTSVEDRSHSDVFVGRQAELRTLHSAFVKVQTTHTPVVVHLIGPSGQGKSALLRRAREMAKQAGPCLVFQSRCRERENLPFKGIDAIVDALSAHLRRFDENELATLRPRSVDALAQMFPILEDLWPEPESQDLNPRELRGVSWAALREVIEAVAEQQPLIIQIDDFQWADVDSVQLIHALLRPPRPPSLLLVLSIRNDLGDCDVLRALDDSEVIGHDAAIRLELGPLSQSEAQELALSLARASHRAAPHVSRGRDRWSETIALRAGGNPFFVAQLVFSEDSQVSGDSDLAPVVRKRLDRLDPRARGVLNVIAVSGGPISKRLVLSLCPGSSNQDIDGLRELGLIVGDHNDVSEDALLETAHDRVRAVAREAIDPVRRAEISTKIGEHLLDECGHSPTAELVFQIADCFNEGTRSLDDLDEAHRLEVAQLNLEAGNRALGTASYAVARTYFDRGYQLIEPWLSDARRGQGHRQLCLDICFGRARSIPAGETNDAIYEDLLHWELAPFDYARIAVERVWVLTTSDRIEDSVRLGVAALRQLGISLPRRPHLPWVLWQLTRAKRTLTLSPTGDETAPTEFLTRLPDAPEGLEREMMKIMALAVISGLLSENAFWGVGLAGLHVQMLKAHGFHEHALMGISTFAMCLAAVGSFQEARAVWTAISNTTQARKCSASDHAHINFGLVMFYPRIQPIGQIAAKIVDAHRDALETGQYRQSALYSGAGTGLFCEAGGTLTGWVQQIDEMHARSFGYDKEFDRVGKAYRRLYRLLVLGREAEELPQPSEFSSAQGRCAFKIRAMWIHVLFGDYDAAERSMNEVERSYAKTLLGMWLIPIFHVLAAVVITEKWSSYSGLKKRRMRRLLGRYMKSTAQWKQECPENFGPMEALMKAELAIIGGDFNQAMHAYEEARKGAAANTMRWVEGLASYRLTVQADRVGHGIVAEAASRRARETYAAWGADALVRKIDQEYPGSTR